MTWTLKLNNDLVAHDYLICKMNGELVAFFKERTLVHGVSLAVAKEACRVHFWTRRS